MKGKTPSKDRFSVILLIILVVFLAYLSLNRHSSLGAFQERVHQEQQALAREQTQLRLLRKLQEQGPRYLEELEHFYNLIPEKAEVHRLLPYLQRAANQHEASLIEVRFEQENESADYIELPLILTVEGSFYNLLQLLRSLREGERAVRIDSIRLVYGSEAPDRLQAELNASVFYQK